MTTPETGTSTAVAVITDEDLAAADRKAHSEALAVMVADWTNAVDVMVDGWKRAHAETDAALIRGYDSWYLTARQQVAEHQVPRCTPMLDDAERAVQYLVDEWHAQRRQAVERAAAEQAATVALERSLRGSGPIPVLA